MEDQTTIPPVTTSTFRKARVTRKAKGKAKHVDVVETNQPSENSVNRVVSFTNTECHWRTLVQFKRDHRCDNQFRVFHKETSWCRVFAS